MAEDDIKVKKERDPIMMVCFVVFLLALCAITGATIYNNYLKADDTVAVSGSSVSVNYTGTYYAPYGEANSVVFDTSYWHIANDDKIIKSNDFEARAESSYRPLSYTVGGTTVLTKFGDAVIGHKVGDKIIQLVPSGEGYNGPDDIFTSPSVKTVPAVEVLTAAQFKAAYGYDLKGHTEIDKSVYGWPATASYSTATNTVTMSYHPVVNTTYTAVESEFGNVALKVTSVGSTISFTYLVSGYTLISGSGDIRMIMVDFGTEKFYIVSVVNAGGTATTFDYRLVEERYNQDLYFVIEIVSIG
ncbi:MAG: FKBP-type peptidyl-prolyl cis-trans isomerase [Methanomassiliicoccaceae archaeon]|nr:FKBP-type peptidyl-prolyl cis-trans isomerase [Methanomassiliicoccaceae archaeon]